MPRNEMQRLKILYIADFLMRETDDDLYKGLPIHGVLVSEIKDYLKEKGIEAEEHSISRDIDLLRGVYKKTNEKGKIIETKYFSPLLDVMGGKGKPIYLGLRYFPFEDLQDIAECIAAAPFLSQNESAKLIEKLQKLCSKYQAERLTREYIVAGRSKHTKRKMLKDTRSVKDAIENNQKISFIYTRHSPKDFKPENRRKGDRYFVSPFKIVLSDGHHYLIGYDDYYHQIRPYRIDRMEELWTENQPREGKEKFDRLRINDYAKQTFGMFIGGKADYITLQFHTDLLDAMIERFGYNSGSTKYTPIDDKHFTIKTFIVESENFYGWVCGLGEKIVILDPPEVAERFKEYLQKIQARYQ